MAVGSLLMLPKLPGPNALSSQMERLRKEIRTHLGNRRQFRVSPSDSLRTSVPSLKVYTEARVTSLKRIGKSSVANPLPRLPKPSQKSVVASPEAEAEHLTQRSLKSRGNLAVERSKMSAQRMTRKRQNLLLGLRRWAMITGKRRSRCLMHGTLRCRWWIRLRRTIRGSCGRTWCGTKKMTMGAFIGVKPS